jgi:hypothetical protein
LKKNVKGREAPMNADLLKRTIALLDRYEFDEDDACLTCGARTHKNHWIKCEWKRVLSALEAEVKRVEDHPDA